MDLKDIVTRLIIYVADQGWTDIVYSSFHALAFICVFFMAVWYGKKLGMTAWLAIVCVITIYPLGELWKKTLFWIETGFQTFGGENIVRLYIWLPVVAYPICKLLKAKWKVVCDFMAPLIILSHGVGHIGCIFAGCCQGYPQSWGLYNIMTGLYHFPIQPIESIVIFVIIFILLRRAKKMNYVSDGLGYPIMLMLFGSTRFICEFLRDNEKILLGCSSLAFHALLAFVIGLIAYYVVKKKSTANP